MSEHTKKIALVTGGGRGIGRAIALKLGQRGYDVAITYRNSAAGAEEVVRQLREMGSVSNMYHANTCNLEETLEAFEQFKQDYGRIDLLVNNAGITIAGDFLTMKPEQFDYCMNVDLRTPYFLSQKAANLMVETKTKGVIINISSNQSEEVFPWASVYGTIKAGLNKLTKHMALELAPYGIRAVAIAPGYCDVWTDGTGEDSNYTKAIKDCIPLKRYSSPAEMGALAVFLASEDAGFITGTLIMVDGGTSLPVSTAMLEIPLEERNRKLDLLGRLSRENRYG